MVVPDPPSFANVLQFTEVSRCQKHPSAHGSCEAAALPLAEVSLGLWSNLPQGLGIQGQSGECNALREPGMACS